MILGLDLGTSSIGWALIDLHKQQIVSTGVRIFEAGMEGNMSDGTQTSRNAFRREQRMLRRQHDRRARRMKKIMSLLQDAQLLPKASNMAQAITAIDTKVLARLRKTIDHQQLAHVIPYQLRADALDQKLDDFELGRALYHLAQRRGFQSNRKSTTSEDDNDDGIVKPSITELDHLLAETQSRTLGEFFSLVDPEQERIRGRYTGRHMFLTEFKAIISKQRELGNNKLTVDFEKKLFRAFFHQRPLKPNKNLIGYCPLEKAERRAPWHHPLAQKFRVLQAINNLTLQFEDGETRKLNREERTILNELLSRSSLVTIAHAKKALGFSSRKNQCTFTIEEGGEKNIPGNQLNARLIPIFTEKRWLSFSEEDQLSVIQDINSYTSIPGLKKRGLQKWELTDEQAEEFSEIQLPLDYAGLSLAALRKLLPLMEKGDDYMTAATKVYHDTLRTDQTYSTLPMLRGYTQTSSQPGHLPSASSRVRVTGYLNDLRNPAVERILTQLRKVVNPIIKKYGKPDEIHIELARDIKKSKKDKSRLIKKMRDQENERKRAEEELTSQLSEFQSRHPNRRDIEKYMLWKECREQCPYTGKPIPLSNLFSEVPEFDIEHIVPYSICLDDSFSNKTLCHVRLNREDKRNRTPYQAFSEFPELYDAMLERVNRFDSSCRIEKLRRFKIQDISEYADFANRQLNDTSYASKLAKAYLASLYGGTYDEHGKQRIFAVSGNITAIVRNYYRLNTILGEGNRKTRSDHRHHALDALVLTIISQKTIQTISKTAEEFALKNQRLMYQGDEAYWDGFTFDAKKMIQNIKVTHSASHKVRGQLHKATVYGKNMQHPDQATYRVKLVDISPDDLACIIDPVVKKCVIDHLVSLQIYDLNTKKINAKKQELLNTPDNLPRMPRSTGEQGPLIKTCKCSAPLTVTQVGTTDSPRYVLLGNNHHIEIFEYLNAKGEKKWEGLPISLMEAYTRKKEHLPIISRTHEGKTFICSLSIGDIIQCDIIPTEPQALFKITAISQEPRLEFVRIEDARDKKQRKENDAQYRKGIDPMRALNMKKITLTPFGEIRNAND